MLRIVFMGTPDFAVESLDAIVQSTHQVVGVVTVPDRQTGRGLKVTYSAVKEYALSHQLPLLQPEKLRDDQFLADLRALEADLFVVVAFRMLPQVVWSMPRLGTFNLHASLLPNYRGAAPINWAIINGEHETGVTTFLLNERIDEGKILLQESTPITPDDTCETLHDRLAKMGRSLVVQTIDGLASGTLHGKPQPAEGLLCPAPKIFKADCAIPWQQSGQRIVDFVRGLSPYPASTMQMIDNKGTTQSLKVYHVSFLPDKSPESEKIPIGSVISDQKRELKIKVIDGFVLILSLQMNGKRKNNIDEFLRGYNVSCWKLVI